MLIRGVREDGPTALYYIACPLKLILSELLQNIFSNTIVHNNLNGKIYYVY
jgi:hypothetical protein